MVIWGVWSSRPLDRLERPEPQMIPTVGSGMDLDWRMVLM